MASVAQRLQRFDAIPTNATCSRSEAFRVVCGLDRDSRNLPWQQHIFVPALVRYRGESSIVLSKCCKNSISYA